MTAHRVVSTAAVLGLSLLATGQAASQVPGVPGPPSLGITIGAKITTLGFGPEVGIGIGPRLGFRAGANFLSLNRDFDFSDIDYSVDLKLKSFTGLVDLYLLGPIRLSGGLVINKNKLELSADPTVAVTIGTTTYQATDVGTITATIDYDKSVAPYLGIGLGGRGRIGFIMELGVMMTGSPQLAYTATTTLTGAAATAFNTEVANETAQVRTDIEDNQYLKLWPVVGFGLQIKI